MVKFYSISQFAKEIGVTSVTLRKWEERGWLIPHHRSPSGYRYYSQEQLDDYFKEGMLRVQANISDEEGV